MIGYQLYVCGVQRMSSVWDDEIDMSSNGRSRS